MREQRVRVVDKKHDASPRTAVAGRAASVCRAAAGIADVFASDAGRPCCARALVGRGSVFSLAQAQQRKEVR